MCGWGAGAVVMVMEAAAVAAVVWLIMLDGPVNLSRLGCCVFGCSAKRARRSGRHAATSRLCEEAHVKDRRRVCGCLDEWYHAILYLYKTCCVNDHLPFQPVRR